MQSNQIKNHKLLGVKLSRVPGAISNTQTVLHPLDSGPRRKRFLKKSFKTEENENYQLIPDLSPELTWQGMKMFESGGYLVCDIPILTLISLILGLSGRGVVRGGAL